MPLQQKAIISLADKVGKELKCLSFGCAASSPSRVEADSAKILLCNGTSRMGVALPRINSCTKCRSPIAFLPIVALEESWIPLDVTETTRSILSFFKPFDFHEKREYVVEK